MNLLTIAAFGAFGVVTRYAMDKAVDRFWQGTWPLSTFLINIIGSFLAGFVLYAAVEKSIISENMRLALATGFLGGFTTFSAYALQSLRLFATDQKIMGLSYLVASPLLGVFSVYLGLWAARQIL